MSKTSQFLAVVEDCWDSIRKVHKDVPEVIFAMASSLHTLGHFQAGVWHSEKKIYDEVFLSGEGLSGPAAEVFETLLHESCHAVAEVRGIKEVGKTGSYHNKKFALIAEEFGLRVYRLEERKHYGLGFTEILPQTEERFRKPIDRLDKALNIYRHEIGSVAAEVTTGANKAMCGCDRELRATKKDISQGLICGLCKERFEF